MKLEWINSAGGPLICASPAAGRIWGGTRGSSVGGAESDYDRACDQVSYVSAIACGSAQVVVLGDEPLQSAFVVKSDSVLVVRWVSCVSSERAASAIAQLPSALPAIEEPTKFRLDDRGLIMFDSAVASIDPAVCSKVDLRPGVFTVTTEKYKSEGVHEFLVHRFIRDRDH
ncbi:MAG: Imm21 family immunity protein [Pseudomonadota bacterium]